MNTNMAINQQIKDIENKIWELNNSLNELLAVKNAHPYYTNKDKTILAKLLCRNGDQLTFYWFDKYNPRKLYIEDENIKLLDNRTTVMVILFPKENLHHLVPISEDEYNELKNTTFKLTDY